jgi:hypothetical protein
MRIMCNETDFQGLDVCINKWLQIVNIIVYNCVKFQWNFDTNARREKMRCVIWYPGDIQRPKLKYCGDNLKVDCLKYLIIEWWKSWTSLADVEPNSIQTGPRYLSKQFMQGWDTVSWLQTVFILLCLHRMGHLSYKHI